MFNLYASFKGGVFASSLVLFGMLATAVEGNVVDNSTGISLEVVGGLMVGVFWAGSMLARLKSGQKSIADEQKKMNESHIGLIEAKKETNRRLAKIEQKLGIKDHSIED